MTSAMERNKRFFQGYLNLEPTDTALFINGLYYDLEVGTYYLNMLADVSPGRLRNNMSDP